MYGTDRPKIRTIIRNNIARLGYPSIREIQAASYLTHQLILIRGLSYQRLYADLDALVNKNHVIRVSADTGHRLRFCPDPCRFTYYRPVLQLIITETRCPNCGARSIQYQEKICSISWHDVCENCNPQNGELDIIQDARFGLKFILRGLALLGVVDYYSVRLPGSIRGYGSEYKRACELVRETSGKRRLLAVVGHINLR